MVRCVSCGIFFLTHPRNKKRKDLGCIFGCRGMRQRHASNFRSSEYYKTFEGKIKKTNLNLKRKLSKRKKSAQQKTLFDETLNYLEVILSLIEKREVSLAEIKWFVRQRGIDCGGKRAMVGAKSRFG